MKYFYGFRTIHPGGSSHCSAKQHVFSVEKGPGIYLLRAPCAALTRCN
jgi:hypothetical protein